MSSRFVISCSWVMESYLPQTVSNHISRVSRAQTLLASCCWADSQHSSQTQKRRACGEPPKHPLRYFSSSSTKCVATLKIDGLFVLNSHNPFDQCRRSSKSERNRRISYIRAEIDGSTIDWSKKAEALPHALNIGRKDGPFGELSNTSSSEPARSVSCSARACREPTRAFQEALSSQTSPMRNTWLQKDSIPYFPLRKQDRCRAIRLRMPHWKSRNKGRSFHRPALWFAPVWLEWHRSESLQWIGTKMPPTMSPSLV